MNSRVIRAIAVLGALGAAALSAQTPQEAPIIRMNVDLVQVDAVVTDRGGRRVTDLKPEDFEIRQDGKVRKITHFSYVAETSRGAEVRPARAPSAVGSGSVRPPDSRKPMQASDGRRTIALVVDDLGLAFDNITYVREALQAFVNQQMQPGDLVAIVRTSAGAGALQQFTSDKRILQAAIRQVKFSFRNRVGINSFATIRDDRSGAEMMGGVPTANDPEGNSPQGASNAGDMLKTQSLNKNVDVPVILQQNMNNFERDYFTVGTLGALQYVIQGVRQLPGRKAVVLFSESMSLFQKETMGIGMLERLRSITDMANRSGVVLYSVDPRGVPVLSFRAEDEIHDDPRRDNPANLLQTRDTRWQGYYDSQVGLGYLADQTGGLFLRGVNDIPGLLKKAVDDNSGYYLIGYRPDEGTFTGPDQRKYREVKVRVLRDGLHVRSRNGFLSQPDAERGVQSDSEAERVSAALASPFQASGIRLRLTSMFDVTAATGPAVLSMLHVDARDLTFQEEADGRRSASIHVVTTTFGEDGKTSDTLTGSYALRVDAEAYNRIREDGFIFKATQLLKKPGAFQFRVVVSDGHSQNVGSASQFIDVPDLKKNRLAMSDILMMSATPDAVKSLTGKDEESLTGYADGHPAIRRFRTGQKVSYGYKILNALKGSDSHPQLESMLRIYRDGQEVFSTAPRPVSMGAAVDQRRLLVGGTLQLGTQFAPGDYTLQVIVRDRLAKAESAVAAQAVDFELVGDPTAN